MLAERGWQHVLLSNHVPELDAILRSLEIRQYFVSVFNSAETGVEKPHREAFENVKTSVPHGTKMWMIGDNFTADVEGAEAVGIPTILVRRPHASATRYSESLVGVAPIIQASL